MNNIATSEKITFYPGEELFFFLLFLKYFPSFDWRFSSSTSSDKSRGLIAIRNNLGKEKSTKKEKKYQQSLAGGESAFLWLLFADLYSTRFLFADGRPGDSSRDFPHTRVSPPPAFRKALNDDESYGFLKKHGNPFHIIQPLAQRISASDSFPGLMLSSLFPSTSFLQILS